jgi:hypothetical protein
MICAQLSFTTRTLHALRARSIEIRSRFRSFVTRLASCGEVLTHSRSGLPVYAVALYRVIQGRARDRRKLDLQPIQHDGDC